MIATNTGTSEQSLGVDSVAPISLDDRLREVETELIRWALTVTRGNKSRAAALLKVKRSTLGDRIKRYSIGRPE